ncbi:MAG: polymer-forming cytoskeletal protein [Defluviimonas sp.]|uniref:bactofilin family protein n=1 Tax=Albidovulum sp. TaxID=1872424 RepID=UPI001E0816B4|nr:polymer-forming cytoskeletal protein [Paracoccaceae bacterium]MCC0064233.1 polymer-forming cytoskeletal protein [Defluviimonas sp.]
MFSKSRINEPGPKTGTEPEQPKAAESAPKPAFDYSAPSGPKTKVAPSVLSADLTIHGNLKTSGDIQVEGVVEGDIRAHLLTVGESATIKGEIVADDIVVNGRVVGRVRGLKVRLTSTARVEGDIVHKTIAIESGAHFEGSVQRQEDPLAGGAKPVLPGAAAPVQG